MPILFYGVITEFLKFLNLDRNSNKCIKIVFFYFFLSITNLNSRLSGNLLLELIYDYCAKFGFCNFKLSFVLFVDRCY